LPELEQVFLRDGEDEGALGLWGSLEASHAPRLSVKALAEDPAMMIYTSGTTGSPKGVLHAHRFLLGHLPCLELSFADFPNSTDVGWTPADWAWIGGLMDMVVPCFYYRVPLVAKRFDRFTAQAAFTLIRDAQVTRAFLPPTALKMMRQGEVPKDARLVSISSGGEPLSADLIAWAKTALGAEVNELYGQTECNLSAGSARAQGFLQFVARDDDLITASGYRIGPTEIEATLAQDPRVIMAAVVAAPDPTRGHVIGAYVTVSKSPEIGFEQDLIAKVAKQLSPHMAPKWVRIVAEMPMTATGKIRHVALREMAARAPAPEQTAG
jgi:acyl-coenzyme A synthetase/AMP-(fatty) acid ligase